MRKRSRPEMDPDIRALGSAPAWKEQLQAKRRLLQGRSITWAFPGRRMLPPKPSLLGGPNAAAMRLMPEVWV